MTTHGRASGIISMKAGEASIPAGRVVRIGSANSVLIPTTNVSQRIVGITVTSGSATGDAIGVCIYGSAKAQAGTNLSTGDCVSFQTATGLLLSTTSENKSTDSLLRPMVGFVLQGGSKSSMVEVLVNPTNHHKPAYS